MQQEKTQWNEKIESRNSEFYRVEQPSTLNIVDIRDAGQQSNIAYHTERNNVLKTDSNTINNREQVDYASAFKTKQPSH